METNPFIGSSFDSFLEEEGVLEEFQAKAIKEVISLQLGEAMKERNLSKRSMAKLLHTSRAQVDRLLDPNDGNVTIETLQRAYSAIMACRTPILSRPAQFSLGKSCGRSTRTG